MTATSVLFLFAAIAGTLASVYDPARYPDFSQLNSIGKNPRKIPVGSSSVLNVNHNAAVGVPIQFTAGDYSGPYDPADPKGIHAAARRRAHMEGVALRQTIKSYIPPGTMDFAKKEVVKLAVNEGKRFAFAHPKETAEIIGIATKTKALYDTASHKLKRLTAENAGRRRLL